MPESVAAAMRRQREREAQEQNPLTGRVNVGDSERWISAVLGGVLAAYGAMTGMKRRSPAGFALAALGGAMVYRGATGHCPMYGAAGISTAEGRENEPIHVEKSVTINRPREEIFQFWRDFENLPQFMSHVESVTQTGDRTSHWIVTAPAGRTVEWDAEIIAEKPNSLISWRTLPGSQIAHTGSVRFVNAPGGRGTEVHVSLEYSPPAGVIGALVAKLYGEDPATQCQEDLNRLKHLMETGEIPTTDGQSSGRKQSQQ